MGALTDYSLQIVATVLASAGLGSLITVVGSRNKNRAETNNIIGKTYGDLLDDLRAQVKYQGDQIKVMQDRELELIKIINGHQEVERDLRKQIVALEAKLNKRINKLEDQ